MTPTDDIRKQINALQRDVGDTALGMPFGGPIVKQFGDRVADILRQLADAVDEVAASTTGGRRHG